MQFKILNLFFGLNYYTTTTKQPNSLFQPDPTVFEIWVRCHFMLNAEINPCFETVFGS